MFVPKVISYTAFAGMMGMVILPIVTQSSLSLATDAALITGVSICSMGALAWNAPSEAYLKWKAPLSFFAFLLTFTGGFAMFFPASRAHYNIWLMFGTVFSSAMVLYHMQELMKEAKTEKEFDPLGNCLSLYLDSIRLFVFILTLM